MKQKMSKKGASATHGNIKADLQNQAGTTLFNANSEEKSCKLKVTDSNRSLENMKENSDSEGGTEGMVTLSNESHIESNIGSIREFSIHTKKNRDSVQESSNREEQKMTPDSRRKTSYKSRQNMLYYSH